MEEIFCIDIAKKIGEIRRSNYDYIERMEEPLKMITIGKEHFWNIITLNELSINDDLFDHYEFSYIYANDLFGWPDGVLN